MRSSTALTLHPFSSLENGKFDEFLDAIRKSGNSSFKYLQNVYTTRDIQHQNISVALALSESSSHLNPIPAAIMASTVARPNFS